MEAYALPMLICIKQDLIDRNMFSYGVVPLAFVYKEPDCLTEVVQAGWHDKPSSWNFHYS